MFDTIARVTPALALAGGLFAVALVAGPGPGYKFGLIALPTAFDMLKYGAYFGMAAVGFGVVAILARIFSGQGATALALVGLLLGVAATGFVMNFRAQAQAVPPIHDITTDTENPPQFVAAVPLREAAGAVNPPDYVGDEPEPGDTGRTIREAQLEAYPEIHSVFLDAEPGYVFTAALATTEDMGWEVIEASSEEGRIEAVDTTFWFGFKDDVVIRIEPQRDGQIRVDVRSKSRVGVSDVGANAARIERFIEALEARTES